MRLSDFLGPVGSNYPPGIDQVAAFCFGDRCSVLLFNGAQFLFPDLGTALEVLAAEANAHPQVLFTIRPPRRRSGGVSCSLEVVPERTLGRAWGRNIPKLVATVQWACLTREVLGSWPDLDQFQYGE